MIFLEIILRLFRIEPKTPVCAAMRRFWMPALLSWKLREPDRAPVWTTHAGRLWGVMRALAVALVIVPVTLQPASAQIDGPSAEDKGEIIAAVLTSYVMGGRYLYSWAFSDAEETFLYDDNLPTLGAPAKKSANLNSAGNSWGQQDYVSRIGSSRRLSAAQGLNGGGATGNSADSAAGRSKLFIWADGAYLRTNDKQRDTDRSSRLASMTAGAGLKLNERTIVGAYILRRDSEIKTLADWDTSPGNPGVETANLDSDSFGGGLVGALKLRWDAVLSGSIEYESGDHDLDIGGFFGSTSSFDTNQVTVQASLGKRFTRGRNWIRPVIGVLHTSLDRDGYVDSIGSVIAGETQELGRFTYGAVVGATAPGNGGMIRAIRPTASVTGIWDFKNEGDSVIPITGAVFATAESGYSLGAGVDVAFTRGMVLRVAGNYFAFDTELDGWSFSAGLEAPVSAFGIGSPSSTALVNLDLDGSAENTGVKARFRIPF